MWFLAPLLIGAATTGAQAAIDSQSGNAERIRDLKRAKARGELVTEEGRALAEKGQQQYRAGLTALQEQQAKTMAMQGATSGADIKAMQETAQEGLAEASERAGNAIREASVREADELEQRLAQQKEKRVAAVNAGVNAAVGSGAALATADAYTNDKKIADEMPDFTGAGDAQGSFEAAWTEQKARVERGEITQAEFNQWQKRLNRYMETGNDLPEVP